MSSTAGTIENGGNTRDRGISHIPISLVEGLVIGGSLFYLLHTIRTVLGKTDGRFFLQLEAVRLYQRGLIIS